MATESRSYTAVAQMCSSNAVGVENADSDDLVSLAPRCVYSMAMRRTHGGQDVKGRLAAAELSDSLSGETVADSPSWRTVTRTHLHPQLAAVHPRGEGINELRHGRTCRGTRIRDCDLCVVKPPNGRVEANYWSAVRARRRLR